jgi:hypothetical protein
MSIKIYRKLQNYFFYGYKFRKNVTIITNIRIDKI